MADDKAEVPAGLGVFSFADDDVKEAFRTNYETGGVLVSELLGAQLVKDLQRLVLELSRVRMSLDKIHPLSLLMGVDPKGNTKIVQVDQKGRVVMRSQVTERSLPASANRTMRLESLKATLLELAREHKARCQVPGCPVNLNQIGFACDELGLELSLEEREVFW